MKKIINTAAKPLIIIWFIISVTGIFSLSPLSVIALTAGILLLFIMPDGDIFENFSAPAAVTGLLFGLFTSFANYENYCTGLFASNIAKALLYGIGTGFLFYFILRRIYLSGPAETGKKLRPASKKLFFLTFAVILACWTVFYLIYFPGIVSEDAEWQLQQACGLVQWSNHHPAAHTLIIGLLYKLGLSIFGAVNGGVATVCIVQMLIAALVYSYTVSTVYQAGFPAWCSGAAAVFYALHPVSIMYTAYISKDSLFAVSILLMLVSAFRLICGPEKAADKILLALGAMGTGLFRSNGIIALIVFAVFFFIKFRKDLKTCIIVPASAVICIIITGPVYNALAITPVDPVEYLSIPLQQIASVYADGGRITNREDAEYLNSIVPVYMLADEYNAHLSDDVKNLIRLEGNQDIIRQDFGRFLKLWANTLVKYPDSYIRAYVSQTSGFWYPERSTVSYHTSSPENTMGFQTSPVLKGGAESILRHWIEDTKTADIFAWLFSNGFVIWIMLAFLGLAFALKSEAKILFVMPVAVWVSVLLSTPVASDNRYIFSIFVTLPLLAAAAFIRKTE